MSYKSLTQKCSIKDCGKPTQSRGWCSKHYQRWLKYGDPLKVLVDPVWDGKCSVCRSKKGPFAPGRNYRVCRKCFRKKHQDWKDENPERARELSRMHALRRYHRLREQVLVAYGKRCVCCGEDEPIFLVLDHIKGGGNKHRRSLSKGKHSASTFTLYAWVIKNSFPKDFRLLCHNCNFAAAHGGCPHMNGATNAG